MPFSRSFRQGRQHCPRRRSKKGKTKTKERQKTQNTRTKKGQHFASWWQRGNDYGIGSHIQNNIIYWIDLIANISQIFYYSIHSPPPHTLCVVICSLPEFLFNTVRNTESESESEAEGERVREMERWKKARMGLEPHIIPICSQSNPKYNAKKDKLYTHER